MAQKRTTISLNENVLTRGKKVAEKEKRSFSSLVELLLENYFSEEHPDI